MQRALRSLLVISMVSVLAIGCASKPETMIPEDAVDAAVRGGRLDSTYDQIELELKNPELGDNTRARLQLQLQDAGRRLGAESEKKIRASLEGGRLATGQVPLQASEQLGSELTKLERYSPETYATVSQDVEREKNVTTQAIAARETELGGLSTEQTARKLELYEELGALHGSGSPAQAEYAQKRTAAVETLRAEAATAIQNEEYSEAQRMLAIVAGVEPADGELVGKIEQVDAKLFEQRFYDALEQGRPDEAYQALVTLSEAENFDKLRPRLADSSEAMADFFIALTAGATEAGNLVNAYRWFGQSRDIRARLGLEIPESVPEAQPFIDEIHRRYKIAAEKGLYGLAWGYLQVIDDVSVVGPSIRREMREAHDQVMSRAVKRLSVAPFTDSHDSTSSYGDTLTAKLLQFLFNNSGDDVRIIEREKLDAIKAEISLSGGDSENLAAVDYMVEGNILEAKVDSSERPSKRRMRVVVDKETVPNPEYDRWASATLKERNARGMVRPAKTITREKKEDIEIGIVNHRKVGVFSVSYRMIDADSAKVLFADTQRVKNEIEDVSTDGVEIGAFVQKHKVAKLPTDAELLNLLADEVSSGLGKRLAEELAVPEARYEEAGDRFVREGNFLGASREFAYATVLGDRKAVDTKELRKKLYDSSVAAGIE